MRIFLVAAAVFWVQLCHGQDVARIKEIKTIARKKPFEYGGNLSLGGSYYTSNAAVKRMAPYHWLLSGSPFIRIYGVQIPFSLTFSETGRSLTHPFRYQFTGASPYYKWAKAHFGYRTLALSDYTMNGMVFNGVGLELNPKGMRFAAFYGVFNPAVDIDSNNADYGVILPAYKRKALGMKLGLGNDNKFVDFVIFKGEDIVGSLKTLPEFKTIRPQENISFGPKFKITLFKHFVLESDVGMSIFTRNVLNDTLPESGALLEVYKFMRVNTTTYASLAGHASFGVNYHNWGVNLRTRIVGADYRSMGINAMQDDLKEYTINPFVGFWKGKISISGSYGFYTDNISFKRLNTTIRKIYNTHFNYQINQRNGLSFGYNNFGTTRSNGSLQQNDSITFSIVNSATNFNYNTRLGNMKRPWNLSFFVMNQSANDQNIFTQKFNNSKTLNLGIGVQKTLKSNLKINTSANMAQFEVAGKSFSTRTTSIGLALPLMKKKLDLGINSTFTQRFSENILQGNIASLQTRAGVKLHKKHQLQFQYRYMMNKTGIVSNQFFNENRFNASYGFTF